MGQSGRRIIAVFLILVLVALIPGNGISNRASASEATEETYSKPKSGIINVTLAGTTALNARADASSKSALVAAIPNGTIVELLGTKKYSDGKLWYRIRFDQNGTKTEAYGFAEYIQIYVPKPANETYASPRPAYVDYSPTVNVRSGPGQNYAMVRNSKGENATLINGTRVEALAYQNGYYKCNIVIDGETKTGWLYADFVRLYTTPSGDEEFVAQMKAQGFPDSYIESLRILHAQHPTWVFTADKTGLDWNTAVNEESAFQRALVNYTSPTSWKRIDDLAYTWKTADNKDGGFKKLDGFHWEAANRTATAYFMDPRNFLTESEVFQFECQSYNPEIHTLERVQTLLEGTFMSGEVPGEYLWSSQTVNRNEKGVITSIDTAENSSGTPLTYAYVFLESAKISGVSPDMLVARVIQEMGTKGTSQIISGVSKTAPGHYNYYDFGTYATADKDAITNGLIYAKQNDPSTCRPWNTRWKSLYGGAIMIGRDYISKGQDTLYYQKFNVSSAVAASKKYTHQYMTNIQAPANEARTMWQACPDLDTVIEFKIPVYESMSDTPAPFPEGSSTANPNPYLKNLAVEGYSLSPAFDYKTLEYDLIVSADTTSVNVIAEPLAATTKVGQGTVQLQPGMNEINVTSTAQYGNSKIYTLNIYREIPENAPDVNATPGDTPQVADPNSSADPTDPNSQTNPSGSNGSGEQNEPADPNTGTTDPNVGTTDPNAGTNQQPVTQEPVVQEPVVVKETIVTPYTIAGAGVFGIMAGTSVSDFLSRFRVAEGGTVTVCNANYEVITDGLICTGYVIKTPRQEFSAIVCGDVNKDGEINPIDLLYVKRHLLGIIELDNTARLAADVKENQEIDPIDLLYIKRHLLEIMNLIQPLGADQTFEKVFE